MKDGIMRAVDVVDRTLVIESTGTGRLVRSEPEAAGQGDETRGWRTSSTSGCDQERARPERRLHATAPADAHRSKTREGLRGYKPNRRLFRLVRRVESIPLPSLIMSPTMAVRSERLRKQYGSPWSPAQPSAHHRHSLRRSRSRGPGMVCPCRSRPLSRV